MKLTLVVLAAGIGSRYGGPKQMEPVGPSGEFIIDYSVYDAVAAGFEKIVFVIRKDIQEDFCSTIGLRAEKWIETDYAFQEPPDFGGRTKPWGTGEAVLACQEQVDSPFGVINADDFYGTQSYDVLAHFLNTTADLPTRYGLVGFDLGQTLSEHGTVSRGICTVGRNDELLEVTEVHGICRQEDRVVSDSIQLAGDELASMNMWGFKPGVFDYLEKRFEQFLAVQEAGSTAEFMLPTVVQSLIDKEQAQVDVLETESSWFGITNPADRDSVVTKLARLTQGGVYPADLAKQYPIFTGEDE